MRLIIFESIVALAAVSIYCWQTMTPSEWSDRPAAADDDDRADFTASLQEFVS